MTNYRLTDDGVDKDGTLYIPADESNRHWRDYLAWVELGNAPQPADILPLPNYRERRAAEYIGRLSPEGNFETSVGDLFDAVIKAIYGDRGSLDAAAAIIAEIKGKYPK